MNSTPNGGQKTRTAIPKQLDYGEYNGLWIATAVNGEVIASGYSLDQIVDMAERRGFKSYQVMEVK